MPVALGSFNREEGTIVVKFPAPDADAEAQHSFTNSLEGFANITSTQLPKEIQRKSSEKRGSAGRAAQVKKKLKSK